MLTNQIKGTVISDAIKCKWMNNDQNISSELRFVTGESCPELFYKYVGLPQLTSDIPPSQLKVCLQKASIQIFKT